jgi:hypothetical protein
MDANYNAGFDQNNEVERRLLEVFVLFHCLMVFCVIVLAASIEWICFKQEILGIQENQENPAAAQLLVEQHQQLCRRKG